MKRTLLAALCTLALAVAAAAQSTDLRNLTHYTLDNGLELYVYRDTSLPLARVEVAFRAGAIAQSSSNAGIFRLYERTVFAGDPGHPGAQDIRSSMADLGIASIDGGAEAEELRYSFDLPSTKIDAGLALCSRIAVDPPLDPAAFASAKADCLAAVSAETKDPASIYEAAMTRRLFAKYPWRRDPAGSAKTLASLDIDSLYSLQRVWLVPGNAALFVCGHVDPEEIRSAVQRSFGAWKAADDPWKKPLPPNPRPGVMRPTWIVYPDPSLPEGSAAIEARYRGPDLGIDPASSYAADLWSSLVSPDDGPFKSALMKNVPGLLGPETITAFYVSQRDGGTISIGAYFSPDPAKSSVDRVRSFKERARGYEITAMKIDPAYFSQADYDAARARLLAQRDKSMETADEVIDELAFWWGTASVDYFLGYPDALAKTGPREVSAFLETYIMRNLEVVALRMNPADFERERKSFDGSGFEVVDGDNAFWWQR